MEIETPGSLVPDDGCGGCGIEKGINNSIASTTKATPCDDCQANGLWAKAADGQWYEVSEGGPRQFTSSFQFPCQFSW